MDGSNWFLGDLAAGRPFVLALLGVLGGALLLRWFLLRVARTPFLNVTGFLERWLLTSILLVLVGLSSLQILLRNVFDAGQIWIDPLLRTLVLWLTFLGAFTATSRGRHIAIDVASRLLPERVGRRLARLTAAVAGSVCVALANGAYEYLSLEKEFVADAFLGLHTWQTQIILLLGFALLAYRFFVNCLFGQPVDTLATEVTPNELSEEAGR